MPRQVKRGRVVELSKDANGNESALIEYDGPSLSELNRAADPRGIFAKLAAKYPHSSGGKGDRSTFMDALNKYAGVSAEGEQYVQSIAPSWYAKKMQMMQPMDKRGMIERYLEMIALPEIAQLERYGDRFQRPPTSINRIHSTFKYSWTQQPTVQGAQQLSPADAVIAVFNDSPLKSHVFYDPNAGNTNTTQPTTSTWIGPSLQRQDLGASTGIQKQENGYLTTCYARYSSVYQPHGPLLFAQTDPDNRGRWIWVDSPGSNTGTPTPTVITITFPVAPTAQDIASMGGAYTTGTPTIQGAQIYIRQWNKGEPINVVPVSVTTTAGTATVAANTVPGPTTGGGVNIYVGVSTYAITLPYGISDSMAIQIPAVTRNLLGSGAASITVTVTDACSHYCQIMQTQYWQNITRFPSTRLTAATLLWSDVASAFAAEGTLAIACIDTAVQWQDMIQSTSAQSGSPWSQINNLPDNPLSKGTWAMIKGCYAFCAPLQHSDMEIKNIADTDYTNGDVYDLIYNPVRAQSQVIVASMNTVAAGMNNQGGQGADSTVTVRHIMEARSADQYTETEVASPQTIKPWEDALIQIREVPQIAENPRHLSDIFQSVREAAAEFGPIAYNAIKKWGPLAAPLLAQLPAVGGPLSLAATGLSFLPDRMVTYRSSGVSRIVPGTGISVFPLSGIGSVTVTNLNPTPATGVASLIAGPGIQLDPTSGVGNVTIINRNPTPSVTSVVAGAGIQLDPTNGLGDVTVINSNPTPGLSRVIAGPGINIAPTDGTGTVTINGAYTGDSTSIKITGNTIAELFPSIRQNFTSLGGTGPTVSFGIYTQSPGARNSVTFMCTLAEFIVPGSGTPQMVQTQVSLPLPYIFPLQLTKTYFYDPDHGSPNLLLANVILDSDGINTFLNFWVDPVSYTVGNPFQQFWSPGDHYIPQYPPANGGGVYYVNGTYQSQF